MRARHWLAIGSVSILSAALVPLSPLLPSSASSGWPQPVDSLIAQQLIARPDGGVAVTGCAQSADAALLFDGAGTPTATVRRPADEGTTRCGWDDVVGRQGEIFFQTFNAATGDRSIEAFKGSRRLWSHQLSTPCADVLGDVHGLGMGADGNLYAVLSYSCPDTRIALISLDDQGRRRFTTTIATTTGQSVTQDALHVYAIGVVVQMDNTFRWFDHAGAEMTARRLTANLHSGENLIAWNVNPAGDLFYQVDRPKHETDECDEVQITDRVVRRKYTGATTTYVLGAQCLRGREQLQVTPQGGAVLYGYSFYQGSRDRLFRLQPDGSVQAQKLLERGDIYGNSVPTFQVDAKGQVVLARSYTTDKSRHFEVRVINAAGLTVERFSTESYDPDGHFVWDNGGNIQGVAIVPGAAYAILCSPYSHCSQDNAKLHRVTLPQVGFEYPRSDLLGLAPSGSPCGDVAVIGVRGSGDNAHDLAYPGLHAIRIAEKLQYDWGLSIFDDDGRTNAVRTNGKRRDVKLLGLAYPAVGVPQHHNTTSYIESVDSGVASLQFEIARLRIRCGPYLLLALVGYSQGADVIQRVLLQMDRATRSGDPAAGSVGAVVLLGSPHFHPRDATARGTFMRNYPNAGIARGWHVPERFRGITRSYCVQFDVVCVFPQRSSEPHTEHYYLSNEFGRQVITEAAALVAWKGHGLTNPVKVMGSPRAYRFANNPRTFLSAGSIFRAGAPSVRFKWDFNNDGAIDQVTAQSWSARAYSRGSHVVATVTVTFADGKEMTKRICVKARGTGEVTC